jgi:hypothetical protein
MNQGSQEERRSKAKQELQLPSSLGSRPQQQELEQQQEQEQEQQQLLQQMPPPQWYVEDFDYAAAEDGPLQQQQQQQQPSSSPPPWQQPRQAEGYLPYNYDKSRRRTMPTSQWGPPPKYVRHQHRANGSVCFLQKFMLHGAVFVFHGTVCFCVICF